MVCKHCFKFKTVFNLDSSSLKFKFLMGSIDLWFLQDEKTTSVEKKVKELTDEQGRLQKTNQGLQVFTSNF